MPELNTTKLKASASILYFNINNAVPVELLQDGCTIISNRLCHFNTNILNGEFYSHVDTFQNLAYHLSYLYDTLPPPWIVILTYWLHQIAKEIDTKETKTIGDVQAHCQDAIDVLDHYTINNESSTIHPR